MSEGHLRSEIAVILLRLAESAEFVSAIRDGVTRWVGAMSELLRARGDKDSQLRELDKELCVAAAQSTNRPEDNAHIEGLKRRLNEVNESCCHLQLQLDARNRIFNFEAVEDLTPDESCVLAACLHLLLNRSEAMLPPVTEEGPHHAGYQAFFRAMVHNPGPDQLDAPVFERIEWALPWAHELPVRLGFTKLSSAAAVVSDLDYDSMTSEDPFSPDKRYFTWNGVPYRLTNLWSRIIEYLYKCKAWGNKSLLESNIQTEIDFESPIRSLLRSHDQLKGLVVRPKDDNGKEKRAEWQLVSPRVQAKKTQ